MENSGKVTLRGIVVFWEAWSESKSQGIYPFLYESADSRRRIMLADDNPFENSGLIAFDGQMVEIKCHQGNGGVWIVDEIIPVKPEL